MRVLLSLLSILLGYVVSNYITINLYQSWHLIPLSFLYWGLWFVTERPIPEEIIIAYLTMGVFVLFPIIFLFKKQKTLTEYGDAKFANLSEIKDSMKLFQKKGIPLARFKGKEIRYDAPLSTLTLAPPGSGKTATLAIPLCFSLYNDKSGSILVHDPKGELSLITAQYRSTFSEVFIFDPASEGSACFNPLDPSFAKMPDHYDTLEGQEKETAFLEAMQPLIQQVASVFIPNETNASDSYWTQGARTMFNYFASWLFWYQGSATIGEIRELINSLPKFEDVLEATSNGVDPRKYTSNQEYIPSITEKETLNYERLKKLLESGQELIPLEEDEFKALEAKIKRSQRPDSPKSKGFIPNILKDSMNSLKTVNKGDGQFAGVMENFRTKFIAWDDPKVVKATSGLCDFTPKSMREKAQSIYVVIRDEDRERLSNLISAVINFFANKLTSEGSNIEKRVTLVLDEFVRLGDMQAIKQFPDISRGMNANAVFIAQSLGQIETVYKSRSIVNTFVQNCAYTLVFAQNDVDSAKRLSQTIGNATYERKSHSKNKKTTSESTSHEGRPLMSQQDIQNIPFGEVIVLAERYFKRPIKAKSNYYESYQPYKSLFKKYALDPKSNTVSSLISKLKKKG